MGKRGKSQNKGNRNPKRIRRDDNVDPADMDDEIDAFHKQRDIVPLDMNGDVEESDEDGELPVFDLKDINGDEDDEDGDDDDGDDDDDDNDDDAQDTSFAAKLARQGKFLRTKFGGVEDEMHDDDDEDEEEEKNPAWGRKISGYYDADNRDFELQSSDDESPAEEEEEVLRLQRARAKSLSMEDFGLEDGSEDESDKELTLEEISVKGKSTKKSLVSKEAMDGMGTTYEEIKKDLNALSREEQMDVVYSSAPELVGLLSELNDALEQLESQVNPLLSKVKEGEIRLEGGIRYLEVKQLLLLAYCQSITFYFLLKSEGQPVRDHPVIARLVEIKGLLDKMKQLDENLPPEFEELLKKNHEAETVAKSIKENAALASDSDTKDHDPSLVSADMQQAAEPSDRKGLVKVESLFNNENKEGKRKNQNDQVGVQSMKMLKVRAALEQRLKQNGVFSSISKKPDKGRKHLKPVNGQLETYDDFDDDGGELNNGHVSSLRSVKLSQLVTAKPNKLKVVSGDDDLPKRDDIGERRRKHELRVLAGAGIKSEDDVGDEVGTLEVDGDADMEDSDAEESEDEYYKQFKQQRAAKHAAKAEIYTRTSAAPSLPETVDGKRQITNQMEKNRGLTRARKKLIKNPRKKYREKHSKQVKGRKGQVRDTRKSIGPYGGEASGINAGISRSIRFKN